MKKLLTLLFLVCIAWLGTSKANAMKFEEALQQSKPVAVLIYAPWAEGINEVMQSYDDMANVYGNKFNFTKINIATEEALNFNKTYHIYPNLPYVLFFKDKGKITRYLKKDCVMKTSCFSERLDFFLN